MLLSNICFFFQLALTIDNLPSVEGSLQCGFNAFSKLLYTDAKRTAQGVTCTTPRNDMLPDIPPNQRKFLFKSKRFGFICN